MTRIISEEIIETIIQAGTQPAQPKIPAATAAPDQPKVVIGTINIYHAPPPRPRKPVK